MLLRHASESLLRSVSIDAGRVGLLPAR